MRISQAVRDFAMKNPPRNGEGDQAQLGGGANEVVGPSMLPEEAEAGMAEMSERYREGGDLYVAVGD